MATTTSVGGEILSENLLRTYNIQVIRHAPKDVPQSGGEGVSWWMSLLTNVVRTLEEVNVSGAHRAIAIDALAGLFKSALADVDARWSAFCTEPSLWQRILCIYFDRANDLTLKPLRQVLDVLMNILYFQKKNAAHHLTVCLNYVVPRCLGSLLDESAIASSRPSMQILDRLFRDGLTTGEHITTLMAENPMTFTKSQFRNEIEIFVHRVLLWTRNPDLARPIGKVLTSFCTSEIRNAREMASDPDGTVSNCWSGPLRALLKEYPETIGVLEQHIFPALLKVDEANCRRFQQELPLQNLWEGVTSTVPDTEIRLSLMLLRANRDLKIELQQDLSLYSDAPTGTIEAHVSFEEQILLNLLVHCEPEIRLNALSLLTLTAQTSQPINPAVIRALGELIKEFFCEVEARSRNEFLSNLRRLFNRLEVMAWRLDKSSIDLSQDCGPEFWTDLFTGSSDSTDTKLLANVNFLETYTKLIGSELAPSASYPRHILALRALSYLQALHLPPRIEQKLSRHMNEHMTSLLTLLMDRFEDVRAQSAHVLSRMEPDIAAIRTAVTNGEHLMRASGRADHADGFGRLIKLHYTWSVKVELENQQNSEQSFPTPELYLSSPLAAQIFNRALFSYTEEIEKLVSSAESDLKRAIADAPLHGRMIALRYLLGAFKFSSDLWLPVTSSDTDCYPSRVGGSRLFCERVTRICERIWRLVHPVLCIDSPEGTDFFAGEDEDDIVDVGTKDTLSYAWRALKESSLLLQAMLETMEDSLAVISVDMESLGDLLFAQLAQLRHRGAFSTVAQTFTFYCSFSTRHTTPTQKHMLESLYSRTLDCVLEKGNALTRRSAGLPALIVGLLYADLGGPFMDRILTDLKEIAQRPAESENAVGLPQVHALNCLKDIFINTKLGPVTEPQLSEVLVIAVDCLDNEIWAIRNSGLMLLKALIVRLEEGRLYSNTLHHTRKRDFSKLAYAKHPALLAVVVGLLESAVKIGKTAKSEDREARLIEKTFPAIEIIERVGIPIDVEDSIKDLISLLLGSSVWAMRNKAASCLALLCNAEEIVHYVVTASQPKVQNALNGAMLLVRHYLREVSDDIEVEKIRTHFIDQLSELLVMCTNRFNQDLLFDVLLTIARGKGGPDGQFLYHCLASMAKVAGCTPAELNAVFGDRALVEAEIQLWTLAHCVDGLGYTVLPQLLQLGEDALHAGLKAFDFASHAPSESQALDVLAIASTLKNNKDPEFVRCLVSSVAKTFGSALNWSVDMDRKMAVEDLENFCDDIILEGIDQEVSDEVCKLYGLIAALSHGQDNQDDADRYMQKWYALMRSGMREALDFEVRQAVLDSIDIFKNAVPADFLIHKNLNPYLGLLLVIYDGVTDDDKDLRLHAARLASWILPEMFKNAEKMSKARIRGLPAFSSTAARSRILTLLIHISTDHDSLFEHCLERIAGCDIEEFVTVPASTSFDMAVKKSTALFDEEKQNQYVDECQEAEDWVRILANIRAPTNGVRFEFAMLYDWCRDGVAWSLQLKQTDKLDGLYGPLGAASQPDAYLALKRTQTLCDWFSRSIKSTLET